MDPVSAAALSWLTGQAAAGSAKGLKRLLLGDQQENALRGVVRAGIEAAVTEVIRADQREDVVEALLREGPGSSDLQVSAALELKEAIRAALSPRLGVLAEQGYEIDAGRLAEVITVHVMSGIRADAARGGLLRPLEEVLRGEAAIGELKRGNLGLDQVSGRLRQVQADVNGLFDQLGITQPGAGEGSGTRGSRFAGREWLFAEVDDFVSGHSRGYVLVEGGAGVGKSTFALWLAVTRQYACHFTRLPGGRTASVASRNLAAQLITALGLEEYAPGGVFPPAAGEPHWLAQLITAAAARQQMIHSGVPLVLVIDGLDEVEPTAGPPLGLPTTLPDGVFIVATMRTGTPGAVGA